MLGTLVGLNFAFERIYFAAPRSFHANLRVCLRSNAGNISMLFNRCGTNRFESVPKHLCRPGKMGPRQGETAAGQGAGIIFKGSGFYTADYRSDSYEESAKRKRQASGKTENRDKGGKTRSQ